MLNIALCDDDRKILSVMKKIINEGVKEPCIIDEYGSGESLIREKKHFDIIFLDIDMKGIDGIETGRRIRSYDKKSYIIYVTNFGDYRKYAFSLHAFGYLEKPVKKEEVLNEIFEAVSYMKDAAEKKNILEFISDDGVVRIDAYDIYYFEYYDRKIKMETKSGCYTIRQKINKISEDMEKYGFVMPHKSFCVNLAHVKKIKGYDIFMDNGRMVPLSQKKSPYFREKLSIFLENLIG